MQATHKAIPASRDRLQSRLLVWTVAPLLGLLCLHTWTFATLKSPHASLYWQALAVSLVFAAIVRLLRAGTTPAALCGAMVCFLITWHTAPRAIQNSALPSLILLFILTFLATRAGKARKLAAGLAESRKGRTAAQVLANLAIAALATEASVVFSAAVQPFRTQTLILAALAEATADTISSEIGQAFGGAPYLLTTFRRTTPGTDGAVTLLGTTAGILAAVLIAVTGTATMHLPLPTVLITLIASTAGLFFDSLLGATLERRGYLGNDLVNFLSTLFAAATAALCLTLLP